MDAFMVPSPSINIPSVRVCESVSVSVHHYKSRPNEMKKAYWNKRLVSQGRSCWHAISEYIQQEGGKRRERGKSVREGKVMKVILKVER